MALPNIRGKKGWNTKLIRSAPAWAPLLDDTAGPDFDYGDIRVAHIDTGYVEHAVFGSWSDQGHNEHILVDRGRNLVDPERDKRPTDPVDGGLNPGHGTRIGSVLYGFAPGDMVGVAPRVPVVPYRAISSVALLDSDSVNAVTNAIHHAVNESFCTIINLSLGARPVFAVLGFGPFRNALKRLGEACDQAYDRGVIVVAALGNNIHDRATYPAKYWRTICAGGLEPVFEDGRLTRVEMWKPQPEPLAEDNYQYIDVWAPSNVIFRARAIKRTGRLQDQYAPRVDGDGTSYAAAAVSGAAAIWLARRRLDIEAIYPAEEPWLVTEAFRKLLDVTRQGEPCDSHRSNNSGILDILNLVETELPKPNSLKYQTKKCEDMWG